MSFGLFRDSGHESGVVADGQKLASRVWVATTTDPCCCRTRLISSMNGARADRPEAWSVTGRYVVQLLLK